VVDVLIVQEIGIVGTKGKLQVRVKAEARVMN
jgi:hypothetical protein